MLRATSAVSLLGLASLASLAATLALTGCSRRMEPPANKNEVPPVPDGDDLAARARGLFDAVAKNDPSLGEPFWFPRAPFLILKDIGDPDGYWHQLHDAYEDDIRELNATRASWRGTSFVRFEQGTPPRWMAPNEEHNFIGYYRAVRGRIRYNAPEGPQAFEVAVIITWQGRWFVTHLKEVERKPPGGPAPPRSTTQDTAP